MVVILNSYFVILNEVKNLSFKHRTPEKADPFLRLRSGQARSLRIVKGFMYLTWRKGTKGGRAWTKIGYIHRIKRSFGFFGLGFVAPVLLGFLGLFVDRVLKAITVCGG